jgi:IS30 family transposase
MKCWTRICYTEGQKAQMWDRWQQGESLHQIARLFDRRHSSVRRILAESRGILPPARRRSERALSLAEREEISRGVVSGQSIRSIAAALGRAPSTLSRELQRNGTSRG